MSSVFPAEDGRAGLETAAVRIDALMQRDPGARGLSRWAEPSDLVASALSLAVGTRVAITTGFFIPSRGVIETDGPVGAFVLAEALVALGIQLLFLVDDHAVPVLQAGLARTTEECRSTPIVSLPAGDTPALRRAGADSLSHIVAVERPGRSATGAYLSMRGEDISSHIAALDLLFTDPERPYTTIGIGDGGNELGLLRVADRVDQYVQGAPRISCRTPADYCLYAGVSNWGAYGLCAMLSLATGRCLLPDPAQVRKTLEALVEAGAVDGVTLEQAPTVDGLSFDEDRELLGQLKHLVQSGVTGRRGRSHRTDRSHRARESREPRALRKPGRHGPGAVVPRMEHLGDTALLWSWPGKIETETSRRVLAAYRALKGDQELRDAGMVDLVPSYCAVALHFDPARADRDRLERRAAVVLAAVSEAVSADTSSTGTPADEALSAAPVHRLPVVYDGPDLGLVAERAGFDIPGVIELHRQGRYTVAMIGFRPHFPYLIGMDERLATPRMDAPRKRVPAGSVGIAGLQTGVYPVESPGGWNIVGRTNPELLLSIRPGDTVVFREVCRCEAESW